MRGLIARRAPASDLSASVLKILDRRLSAVTTAPIAVAVSGGGDSVALALIAAQWAARADRRLVIFTVDHRLNPASPGWTRDCAGLAARLGADFQALAWTGDKPRTGLPAAARVARHGLLADAARAAGARVILLGHTLDDRAEAAAMRAAGSTTPDPREWAPSPVWPQGRELFLLRPLLGLGRATLRDWLAARNESWIEDPANENPQFGRARARRLLGGAGVAPPVAEAASDLADLARTVRDEAGLVLSRTDLRAAAFATARSLTAAACLCAAGSTRPPRGERLDRLTRALRGEAAFVATLAGARIEATVEVVRWLREPGELERLPADPINLEPGVAAVWDGRYEAMADRRLSLQALSGRLAQLTPPARAALSVWPAAARGALPAVVGGRTACPLVEPVAGLTLRSLAQARLLAACGAIETEPA